MSVPTGAAERKAIPLATGLIDYFPLALLAVAELSRIGGEQHHPGAPLHWDRSKSGDESDALMRHFVDRGMRDTDGVLHSTKVAWRALANLQKELEAEQQASVVPVDSPSHYVPIPPHYPAPCGALYPSRISGSFPCDLESGHDGPHKHGADISWGHSRA